MSKFLRFIGFATIVCAFILGIVYGVKKDPILEALDMDEGTFRWVIALTWWISGVISGTLFIAFSMMLDYLEENNSFLRELYNTTLPKETPQSGSYASYAAEVNRSIRGSKSSASKLEGYKFKAND
ncbi:hypothetical protein [Paenibacillus sp. FSL R7-0128]|uniref:hypothetical protein n=1 Tax=Paenibacillus sp. FSL R7-0128 TaxID=2954529 RepID=UPI0030FB1489